ncbi:MAG: hypothetical protein LBS77_01725 [Desulfovibrio sp.]|jgi:hypothetical protein|nr:hypothetical protein [Desulfovibrio sp.]
MLKIAAATLLLHLFIPEALAEKKAVEVTELWTGGLYTSTYRVGICLSSIGDIRGVVYLRRMNGKMDVYHIVGTIHDNKIEASHSSGHTFEGKLVTPDTVKGVITLKSGLKIELGGMRKQGVPLAPEDCAPLDSSTR